MHADSTSSIRTLLQAGLTTALRARDRAAVTALRTTLAAIANAEAIPVPDTDPYREPVVGRSTDVARRHLDEAQIVAIVRAEHHERVNAAGLYKRLGQPDDAAALQAEARILATYLPPGSA